jgi:hypothetical protein
MPFGSELRHIRFLVTVLSTDPPELLDVVATPLGDGWRVTAKRDGDETPEEWYAPRATSPILRMIGEGPDRN